MLDERGVKAIVDDFSQWRGNAYTLAVLIFKQTEESAAAKTRDLIATQLESAGMVEAAAVVRGE